MSFKEELLQLDRNEAITLTEEQLKSRVENTISKTFSRVGGMLLIAFGIAYTTALGVLPIPYSSGLFRISSIAGLGLIFLMSRRWQRMSYETLAGLMLLFAVLEGFGLTGVFYAYDIGSIYNVFLTTGAMFIGLSVAGYYTKTNILSLGPILFMGLIGLIVAMIINAFRQNSQFDIWISIIGIVIFAGFIMYDMQALKQQAIIDDKRIPLLIALGLFINFINIFMFLLRLMGGSSD